MWTCSRCGEQIEKEFEVCWSCGTSVEGVVDTNFQASLPNPELDEEVSQELVTVTSCSLPAEALAIRLCLEAEGIPVFLADEYTVTMDWLLSNAIGGVKVQVPKTEAERALEVLARQRQRQADNQREDDSDQEDE